MSATTVEVRHPAIGLVQIEVSDIARPTEPIHHMTRHVVLAIWFDFHGDAKCEPIRHAPADKIAEAK